MLNFIASRWSLPIIFIIYFGPGTRVEARVATAPSSPDRQVINPAVSVDRQFLGHSFNLHRDLETDTVQELTNSSVKITTEIDSFNCNNIWRKGKYTFELGIFPQYGKKTTSSSYSYGLDGADTTQNNTDTTSLTLVPIQGVVSTHLSPHITAGLKLLYTRADVNDNSDVGYINGTALNQNKNTIRMGGQYTVIAPGLAAHLGQSGFSVSYMAEFMIYSVDNDSNSSSTQTSDGVSNTSTTQNKSHDLLSIRKDVWGLGYEHKVSGKYTFRTDLSMERMPPLSRNTGNLYGELERLIVELNFSYFRGGVEVTQKKGYYVDPTNLIPFFFNSDNGGGGSDKPVLEYSFFGGLKTSKGHSFGISFSQSKSTSNDGTNITQGQPVLKQTLSYGLSYMYVF